MEMAFDDLWEGFDSLFNEPQLVAREGGLGWEPWGLALGIEDVGASTIGKAADSRVMHKEDGQER